MGRDIKKGLSFKSSNPIFENGRMRAKLVKNILLKIEACLKDRGKHFSVEDVKTEDTSRTTVYRYIRNLREENVLQQRAKKQYTVSDKFRQEIMQEIREK